LEWTPQEMAQLRQFGFKLRPAIEFMQKRQKFLNDMQTEMLRRQQAAPAQARSATAADALAALATIPGFPCYETVEESYSQAQAFATSKPNLATWIDVGNSWFGRLRHQSPQADQLCHHG
jgi:carboxypeptidase T